MSKIRRRLLMMLIDQKDKDYLCMSANSASTVGLSRKSSYQSLEYSFNRSTWTTMTTSTSLSLNTGDKLYIRGKLTNNNSDSNYTNFSITGDVSLSGDIRYVWNYENLNAVWRNWCGYRLFSSCGGVKDIMNLTLCETDTILSESCFAYMFYDCSMTTVPVLPSLHHALGCYQNMFNHCLQLTTVPHDMLPATTLVRQSYWGMFKYCSNLRNIPDLPATTLALYCYGVMFDECTNLSVAPHILPATTLYDYCYLAMFRGTAISTAPILPAQILKRECYKEMFNRCPNLNYIKCLATSGINSSDSTYYWTNGVASSGTFVKDPNTNWPRNKYGIPSNWSVQNNE